MSTRPIVLLTAFLLLCESAAAQEPPFVGLEEATLIASDGESSSGFGHAVAMSPEGILVLGAWLDDHVGGTDAGAAYVFTHDGSNWTEQAKLTSSDAEPSAHFGLAVAISEETVLIGAPRSGEAGAAYVFIRNGDSWIQQARLTAADGEDNDRFGHAVAIDGDTAIVSAAFDDAGTVGPGDHGSAYVFTRSGTAWSQQAKLIASDPAPNALFGNVVAIEGNNVVVGAQNADLGDLENAGAAYAFTRNGSTWVQVSKLTASDASATSFFGCSVSISEDTVLLGATGDDTVGPGDNAGSAYIFVHSGSEWSQEAKLEIWSRVVYGT